MHCDTFNVTAQFAEFTETEGEQTTRLLLLQDVKTSKIY
jgi:hypothetical protein